MSKHPKLTVTASLAVALLVMTATGAAAEERAEWLRSLANARAPQGTPASAAPSATVFTQRGTGSTRPVATSAPLTARAYTRGTRPVAPAAAGFAPVQTVAAGTAQASARVRPSASRTIGGRIIMAPMTVEENRSRATRLRTVALAPGGGLPQMDPAFLPAIIPYEGPHKPGTIIISTQEKYLYLVQPDGTARRYGIGVGREGFQWSGTQKVSMKREWPGWTPPAAMRKREPHLPAFMEGGPENPLGARAMYLGSSIYRIHGSNAPWTIGTAVSSRCIRMRNEDVTELYDLVKLGTKVIVL